MQYLILLAICRTVGTPNWAVWLAGILAALEFLVDFYKVLTDSD